MDIREINIYNEGRLWDLGDIDPELTLCIGPVYVFVHCVKESDLRFGDNVAISGLGAIGLLTVRVAREAGAENVFAVDSLSIRREWAARNGANCSAGFY